MVNLFAGLYFQDLKFITILEFRKQNLTDSDMKQEKHCLD